jgi:hypothetical protein
VAICAKFEQPVPWHRSTWYPVTPTLSVEAVQLKLICALDAAVAVSPLGGVGGVVSDGGSWGGDPTLLHPFNPRTPNRTTNAANRRICVGRARDEISKSSFLQVSTSMDFLCFGLGKCRLLYTGSASCVLLDPSSI